MSVQLLSVERRSGERRQSEHELSYYLHRHGERRRLDRRQTVLHAFLWQHQQLRAGR